MRNPLTNLAAPESKTGYIFFFIVVLSCLMVAMLIPHLPPVMPLMVAAGAIAFVISFLKPQVGLFILLIAMLFSPEVVIGLAGRKAIAVRGDDILIIVIAFGWLAGLAVRKEIGLLVKTPLNRPIIILSLIMAMATLVGFARGTVALKPGFFFTLKRIQYFLIFFMVINNIRTLREVKICIVLLLIAIGIIDVAGVIQRLIFFRDLLYRGGVIGTFGIAQANILGGFCVFALLLILGLFSSYESLQERFLLRILFALTLAVLLFTQSRGAYVAFCVAFIAQSIITKNIKLVGISLMALPLMIYLVPLVLPQDIMEQVASIRGVVPGIDISVPSWEARLNAWRLSIPHIVAHPFLGEGLGSIELGWVDNHYVLEARYMGLTGLGVFIWLVINIFRTTISLYKQSKDRYIRGLSLGFLGGFIGLLVHAVTAPTFYTIRTMSPFWFLTGLVMVAWNLMEESKGTQITEIKC